MNEFWAALSGAVVGGIISGAAAWWTTHAQWRREHLAKRQERLEDQLGRALRLLGNTPPRVQDGAWVAPLRIDTIEELHFARVSASGISPHLTALMEEVLLDADGDWRRHIPDADIRVLSAIVARWVKDPAQFEREQHPLEEYRQELRRTEPELSPRRRRLLTVLGAVDAWLRRVEASWR